MSGGVVSVALVTVALVTLSWDFRMIHKLHNRKMRLAPGERNCTTKPISANAHT